VPKADSWTAIKVDSAEFQNMNAAYDNRGCVVYTAKDDAVLKVILAGTDRSTSHKIANGSRILVSGSMVHIQTAQGERTGTVGEFPIQHSRT
jgi:hypothetical protein